MPYHPSHLCNINKFVSRIISFHCSFYTPVKRWAVLWNGPVSPFTCERDILKNACQIDFTIFFGLYTTKTSNTIDLGHSTKTKMATTSVWRLTLYPIDDIACERDILKNACQIDFTILLALILLLKTSNTIDLGHSTKTKMATTSVWRLTLYPIDDIACERDILKNACQIDFNFLGLNTTKTSNTIDLGHSTKTKMAATSVWRLTLYPIQDIACERDILKNACQIDFTFRYGLNTIPLRPQTLLIWGILRKPRCPPHQLED